MRSAAAVVLAAVVAGCGGAGERAASPGLSAESVREAPERVRAEGSFAFEASYVRRVPGKPDERYLVLTGAVDVRDGSGRMEADFSELVAPLPGTADELDEPIPLSWTRERLTARAGGEENSLSRARARTDAGVLGRLPDEPPAVVDLLGHAERVRRVGDERTGDVPTTRFSFVVDPFRAGNGSVPAEFGLGLRQLLAEPRLPIDVWLDPDGLPRRIEYVFRLKPLDSEGEQVLPARSVLGVYELSGFGEPVASD